MILLWAGYGMLTWGYILVKGDNITLAEWFSPLHPYSGALSAAGPVPQGQVFPGGSGAAQGQNAEATSAGGKTSAAGQSGSGPIPGTTPANSA
jgi:hypothetical protein